MSYNFAAPYSREISKGKYIQDVFLWREWKCGYIRPDKSLRYKIRLMPAHAGRGIWEPGLNNARCVHGQNDKKHSTPSYSCHCGFYGFYSYLELFTGTNIHYSDIFGVFQASGRTVVGQTGMRSAQAEVKLLFVNKSSYDLTTKKLRKQFDRAIDQLSQEYQVQVIVIDNLPFLHDLLLAKAAPLFDLSSNATDQHQPLPKTLNLKHYSYDLSSLVKDQRLAEQIQIVRSKDNFWTHSPVPEREFLQEDNEVN